MSRKKKPVLMGLFLLGIVFLAAGTAIAYYLGKDFAFSCNRSVNECVIEEKNVLGKIKILETINLRKLAGAEVIEKSDKDGNYKYKVILITNQARIPLSFMFSDSPELNKKNVEQINYYVNSSADSLVIEKSGKVKRNIGFAAAGLGGLFLLGFLAGIIRRIFFLFVFHIKK